MKKLVIGLFAIVMCLTLATGCGNSKSDNKENNASKMSKEDIIDKLYDINNDLTTLWNDVIVEVDHYSYDGTSSTGKDLDIDFVVSNMDKPYNKCVDNKKFVDSLADDYSDFISAYDKAMEQAKIIYDNIKKETPKANSELSYKSNIDLFQQYESKFYDLVNNAYFED